MLNLPQEISVKNRNHSLRNQARPLPADDIDRDDSKTWPTRVSVAIQRTSPLNNLSELITSQPFMDEFKNISTGWICQDFSGNIAACSMSKSISIYSLVAHLIEWGKNNRYRNRFMVLIARNEPTTSQSYSRLRAINRLMASYFGRKMGVCLVTKSDLLYIRSERCSNTVQ